MPEHSDHPLPNVPKNQDRTQDQPRGVAPRSCSRRSRPTLTVCVPQTDDDDDDDDGDNDADEDYKPAGDDEDEDEDDDADDSGVDDDGGGISELNAAVIVDSSHATPAPAATATTAAAAAAAAASNQQQAAVARLGNDESVLELEGRAESARAAQNEQGLVTAPWAFGGPDSVTLKTARSYMRGALLFEIKGELLSGETAFKARYGTRDLAVAQWAFPLKSPNRLSLILDARDQPADDKVFLLHDRRWIANPDVRSNVSLLVIGRRLFVSADEDLVADQELVVDFGTPYWGDTPMQIMTRVLFYMIAINLDTHFTVREVCPFRLSFLPTIPCVCVCVVQLTLGQLTPFNRLAYVYAGNKTKKCPHTWMRKILDKMCNKAKIIESVDEKQETAAQRDQGVLLDDFLASHGFGTYRKNELRKKQTGAKLVRRNTKCRKVKQYRGARALARQAFPFLDAGAVNESAVAPTSVLVPSSCWLVELRSCTCHCKPPVRHGRHFASPGPSRPACGCGPANDGQCPTARSPHAVLLSISSIVLRAVSRLLPSILLRRTVSAVSGTRRVIRPHGCRSCRVVKPRGRRVIRPHGCRSCRVVKPRGRRVIRPHGCRSCRS